MMAGAQKPFLAAVLLLVSSGLRCSSPLPSCPESCTCQTAPLLNCSSAGLSLLPQQIQDSVTDLDLSHNLLDLVTLDRPHHNLRNVWLGNNSITHFSLCIRRHVYVRGRHLHRLRPWRGHECVSWAPTLQLLSVERNQLEELPQGLKVSESLQVLRLSFNRISTLQPGELNHLQKLKELHLQHNLIKSLHPQMFQDLVQLQVLDLSFNMLTSIHPLTYLTLRNIGADVDLDGNRWQCDCGMRSLRKQMAFDTSRGMEAWSVVCSFPSTLSGRHLLRLENEDLKCIHEEKLPELHQDVTVLSGSDIVLSCTKQDSKWWTPRGQASSSQPQAALHINDITERDTGLYVCVSEEHEIVSVYNLQMSQIGGARRKIRSLPRNRQEIIPQDGPYSLQEKNLRATQSDLALAVCLSIFFTFLIAFILGVLARPCVDVLWRRITKKENSSVPNSVSSVEGRQYDNEAYSNGEESEHIGHHRERRVTFSNMEDSKVQYYDAVAGANQESVNRDAVIECEAAETEKDRNTAGDSGSDHSLQQSSPEDHQRGGRDFSLVTDAGHTPNIEYEHIPDPDELGKRRSMSSGSDSSQSDIVINEKHMTPEDQSTPKTHQLTEDSAQQRGDFPAAREVEVPQIYIEAASKLPGFSSEPFTDWSPYTNNPNLTDPDLWQENEENFEFSDSVRSTSARSSGMHGSFNGSKQFVVPTFNRKTDDMSSSSSYVSEDEPTQYTVNSDQEQAVIKSTHKKPDVTNDSSFEQQINIVNPITPPVLVYQGDDRYDTKRRAVRPENSLSSHSSDSDQKDHKVKRGLEPSLAVTCHGKNMDTKTHSPSTAFSSSSEDESEADTTDLKKGQNKGRMLVSEPGKVSSDLDCQHIPQTKKHVNINAPLPSSDLSSSDESTDETTKNTKKQEQGPGGMVGPLIKEYQSVSHDPRKPQQPIPDLDHVTPIKEHLDIRAPTLLTTSCSSDESADETISHIHEQKQGVAHLTAPPTKVSQTVSHDSDTLWPAVDLENTTYIKRHLDIKAPSLASDSSSSSDSEGETTNRLKEKEQEEAGLPVYQNLCSLDLQTQWPALDLEHIPRIKRRLDVKAQSPPLDSSSSSESEEETNYIKKQDQGEMFRARPPSKVSQTAGYHPQTQWPTLDLDHNTSLKRRLDIKGPSPDSSSSSDSEDETTHHSERPGKVDIAGLPFQESQTGSHVPDTKWPALDLEHIPQIKRCLDVKAQSPPLDSSSSSDSEEETNYIKKQDQGEMSRARPPSKVSQTAGYHPQTQWPTLDLDHNTSLKRRLDIKGPSPDSSSSSDSEDETTHHSERPGKVDIAGLPFQESQTGSHVPDTKWPALDLEHIPQIQRRLDIKARSPPLDSSSSSDSEEDTNYIKKQEQGEMSRARPPSKVSQTSGYHPQTQWPTLDLDHSTSLKRRLDIKGPSPDSSSGSDSEDETTHHSERPGKVDIAGLPFQESNTGSHVPDTKWPALDLEHIPQIKRRLDIKAQSPPLDSSSSSDSEEETNYIKKQDQGEMSRARPPSKVSQTAGNYPQTQWPTLDLDHNTSLKRRLDIKGPSPDSSSSSDSEDETTHHSERPGKVDIAGLPLQESQTGSHVPNTRWPTLDLEHIPQIKRRLDVKAQSPPLDSSSSSESEEETNTIKKQEQREMSRARPSSKVSQTAGNYPQTQWPTLDLDHNTSLKRRLDIKGPSPDSSSSSDSEDETTHHSERPGKVDIAGLPLQESQTGSHVPNTRWPTLDLEHIPQIKRRLDVKAQSPPLDSSSSSESEEETNYIKKQEQREMSRARPSSKVSQTAGNYPQTQWPTLDLDHNTSLKRRLDIKAPPPDSCSSSDTEDETIGDMEKQKPGKVLISELPFKATPTGSRNPDKSWPLLDLEHTASIKRRLDIKAPSPDSSSSSDSENETKHQSKKPGEVDTAVFPLQVGMKDLRYPPMSEEPKPEPRRPPLDLNTLHVKRSLDIKAPSPPLDSSSSSDETEGETTSLSLRLEGVKMEEGITSYQPGRQLSDINVNVPPVKRRLNIKGPSQPDMFLSSVSPGSRQSESNSSSESEDESRHQTKPVLEVSAISKSTEKKFIRSPRNSKTDQNVKLENYTLITDEVRDKTTSASPEINPELQSRWATMNLGISRFRKRLEITSHESPKLPSTPPPGSPSSSISESETGSKSISSKRKIVSGMQELSPSPETKHVNVSLSAPNFKRSISENEIINHSVPDLSLGVPRIKRRLNVKTPLPEPSNPQSSSSNSENELAGYTANKSRHESNMSDMTDNDSLIMYKRLIIKSPSLQETLPSQSFNDIVKNRIQQPKCTTDMDLPPEIRWTGVGRQLSDRPIPSPRRYLDGGLLSPKQALLIKPELPPSNSSSSESDDSIKQEKGKTDVPLMKTHSSLGAGSVSPVSSRVLDKFGTPHNSTNEILRAVTVDRKERKGLSALKAMSSERRKWDEKIDIGSSPLFDYHGSQDGTHFNHLRSEKAIKDKQPQRLEKLDLSSTSALSRDTDISYGFPRYRRHNIGGIEPPKEAPPPIPSTPPPYEAVGLTKLELQGTRSYPQQSKNTEESDLALTPQNLAVYFDSSNVNISEV